MKLLFTKSDAIMSKAIRGVTKESVSHVVIEIPFFGIVIHSNLLGVHCEWAETFRKRVDIIYELSPTKEETIFVQKAKIDKIMNEYQWSCYDFGALIFTGIALLARHYFKIPLPKKNLWNSSGMFMCTEFVQKYIDEEQDAMITPEKFYYKLKASGQWI